MEIIKELLGAGKDLSPFQMGMRTIVIFFVTLILIRLSGKRSFGMHMPIDNVLTILLGALLSRAIVGASPLVATIVSGFVLVVLYRICSGLSVFSKLFGKMIKGEEVLIFKEGKMLHENMKQCMVSEKDLLEEVRTNSNLASLNEVDSAYVERNGQISIVKKPSQIQKNHQNLQ